MIIGSCQQRLQQQQLEGGWQKQEQEGLLMLKVGAAAVVVVVAVLGMYPVGLHLGARKITIRAHLWWMWVATASSFVCCSGRSIRQ